MRETESRMYYTIQPHKVITNISETGSYELSDPHTYMNVKANEFREEAHKALGYFPIYCFPYTDALHLWFETLWLSPQYPEDFIFFKSSNIEKIAYKEMRRIWNGGVNLDVNVEDDLYEYITDSITIEQIYHTFHIGKTLHSETADNACFNMAQELMTGILYLKTCHEFHEEPIIQHVLTLYQADEIAHFFDMDTLNKFIDYEYTVKEYKRAFYEFKNMLYEKF